MKDITILLVARDESLTASVKGSLPALGGLQLVAVGSCAETRGFIHRSDGPLGKLLEQAHRVAPSEASILIQGETGTGKTHFAQLIHELSPRRQHPFLTIDCGALSGNLIESELFGHVRGA